MQKTATNQIVAERERYFVAANLTTDEINCADDRSGNHIHLFGGALFVPYNRAVLQEAATPGSVNSLLNMTIQTVQQLADDGIQHQAIHSDTAAEHGDQFLLDSDGAVGCKYAQSLADISRLIVDNGAAITTQASRLFPELFSSDNDRALATEIIAAHGRLSDRADTVTGSGRELERQAIKAGAVASVFGGQHDPAAVGIINTQPNSTFDTPASRRAGLPTYVHELWASDALFSRLSDAPDARTASIASVIDILGVYRALDVRDVARR